MLTTTSAVLHCICIATLHCGFEYYHVLISSLFLLSAQDGTVLKLSTALLEQHAIRRTGY
jgi:hypothetical protein